MNKKIVFYDLADSSEQDIFNNICQLCHQYYLENRHVYILCPDNSYCLKLDEFMINYQIDHFFPYQIYGDGPIPPAPICLGIDATTKLKYDILINLHSIIPDNFVKYRQIIEFVAKEPEQKALAREHYIHYKKLANKIALEIEYKNITESIEP